MKTALILFALTAFTINLQAQDRSKDTLNLDSKSTPRDTLAPFDRSSNKHIEIPNPNRPPTNADPVPPKQKDISIYRKD